MSSKRAFNNRPWAGLHIRLRRDVSKNETFWHDSDPWRIFSTSSRGLWAFPRALTYIYGIPTSLLVEPACATVTSPQSEVRRGFREWTAHLYSGATPGS